MKNQGNFAIYLVLITLLEINIWNSKHDEETHVH